MKIEIGQGEEIVITLEDTDGEFTIKWGEEALTIEADLPDDEGRGGHVELNERKVDPDQPDCDPVIYRETFGRDMDEGGNKIPPVGVVTISGGYGPDGEPLEQKVEIVGGLRHRDKLLGDLAAELKRRDHHNAKVQLENRGHMQTTNVIHIHARLVDAEGEVLLDGYFGTVLEYVVEDIYWDENGDWADAVRVEFE